MAKSADAFRTIAEVAEWLDTPAHVLRFWESKFNQIRPVKRAGGRRYYRPEDMALLGGIKTLLQEEGLSVKGAQKMLRERGVKYVSGLSPPLDGSAPIRDVSPPEQTAKPAEAPPAPVMTPPQTKELPAFRPFGGAGRPAPAGPVLSGRTEPSAPSGTPSGRTSDPPVGKPQPGNADGGLPSFLTGKSGIGAAQHRPDPPISAPDPNAGSASGGAKTFSQKFLAQPEGSPDSAPAPLEAGTKEPDTAPPPAHSKVSASTPPALPPVAAPPEVADLLPRPAVPTAPEPPVRAAPPARVALVRQGPGFLALLEQRDRLAAAPPEQLAALVGRLGALAGRLAEDPSRPAG